MKFKNSIKFIVIYLLAFSLSGCMPYVNHEKVTAKVRKTERIVTSNGKTISSYYLVFTDKEVFACQDTIFYWKWNSSDIYGQIEEGKTYIFDVYGIRSQFLSTYRNILSVQEVVNSSNSLQSSKSLGKRIAENSSQNLKSSSGWRS